MKDADPKILIVDDEPYNIALLVNILKFNYNTVIAKNGEEALKRATSAILPDLILLDIMMPDMNGYEVCQRLKADPKTRDIPVIFVTAMDEMEDEKKGLELGAIDYITKPVSPPIVKARVKNHLELTRARQRLEAQNQELLEAARLREDVEHITRHDLKNPLNAVLAYPELILELGDNLNEKQKRYLLLIEDAGRRMLNMINLSLDLFKMEKGLYQLQPNPVNIAGVVRRIEIEMERQFASKHLTLDIRLSGKPLSDSDKFFIRGEELLCYSMLANLLKNAHEASPPEQTITIDLDDGEHEAIIRIQNIGEVPEAIRERFFEKYITFGKKNAGTGLGTYSARLIAETQHGTISMSCVDDNSTTITIRLPTIDAVEPRDVFTR